jgi:hypothetical protein
MGTLLSRIKSLAEFAPAGAKEMQSYFAGACISRKTPLAVQVCASARSAAQALSNHNPAKRL